MRMMSLALLMFCAVISGWTAALAQIEMRGMPGHAASSHMHNQNAASHEVAGEQDGCGGGDTECRHPSKSVHPLLCAACFAIETSALAITPPRVMPSTPVAMPQATMIATKIKPRYPPPKFFFQA